MRVRKIKRAGLRGRVLHFMVREDLTYNMVFEGSEEANHGATLGRVFQVGERASTKAPRWERAWQLEGMQGASYGWSGVSNRD